MTQPSNSAPQSEGVGSTALREQIARVIDPSAQWGREPCKRFKGTTEKINWDEFYVWDNEHACICNPDGPNARTYPWSRMETAEQSVEAAQRLNDEQDHWWTSAQEWALAKADAILALSPIAASPAMLEAAQAVSAAHADTDGLDFTGWCARLAEAVEQLNAAISQATGASNG